jgi:hypothetical protein
MDRLKKENPGAVPAVENQQKALGTQLNKEHAAVKKADVKEVKVDDTRVKMEAILKARQAAQSATPKT